LLCSKLCVATNVAYLVRSEVLESLYRWVTGYVPETACCVDAGLGTGKTGTTTVTAKGRLYHRSTTIQLWNFNISSSNDSKDFVQCCHDKHTVVNSRTLLHEHLFAISTVLSNTALLYTVYFMRIFFSVSSFIFINVL